MGCVGSPGRGQGERRERLDHPVWPGRLALPEGRRRERCAAVGWVLGLSNQIAVTPSANASNISDDIIHALHRSWFFNPQTIKVGAQGGNVEMTGTVQSWRDREIAAEIAWAAPGTTSVANNIVVNSRDWNPGEGLIL